MFHLYFSGKHRPNSQDVYHIGYFTCFLQRQLNQQSANHQWWSYLINIHNNTFMLKMKKQDSGGHDDGTLSLLTGAVLYMSIMRQLQLQCCHHHPCQNRGLSNLGHPSLSIQDPVDSSCLAYFNTMLMPILAMAYYNH